MRKLKITIEHYEMKFDENGYGKELNKETIFEVNANENEEGGKLLLELTSTFVTGSSRFFVGAAMSKDEINRIETLAASFFENSNDVIAVSFAIQTCIERRKELRRRQELEMKS